ncbi:MAG: hypothetical protein U0401_10705 [Anaerolineae bacterium]
MNHSLAPSPFLRSLRRLRAAFWRRRVLRWLIRAAWLALLVPTIFMAGYLWRGWEVRWLDWLVPMALVALISLLWSIRPLRLKKMIDRLDRRLALQARLITAQEVDTPTAADNPVVQQLLLEAVNIVIGLRQRIRAFDRGFWLEFQALIGVAALLSALLLLDALTPDLPNATVVELPAAWQEPKADAIIPPDPHLMPPPFQPQMQAQQTQSAEALRQALGALADALRDQAVTRSIAEALDRGDLAGAAAGLRRLADQLGDLSAQARTQLGEALQEAAQKAGSNAPNVTEPAQAGSQALGADNLQAAQQALEALAEAIESLAQTPQESAQAEPQPSGDPGQQNGQAQANAEGESQPQNEGEAQAQQPGQSDQPGENGGTGPGSGEGTGGNQPSEDERLAIEGQPLELKSDGQSDEQVLQPAKLDAQAGDGTAQDSPFGRQPANAATSDLGPDPLTYPWAKREVIRKYFTP